MEIALAYQKSLYIDDITGCADLFEVPLRLITPPCVKPSPIYIKHSMIEVGAHKQAYENINISTLPQQESLQFYLRNKWLALITYPLEMKLRICFFTVLLRLGLLKIARLLMPWRRYNPRIYRVRNR